APGNTVAHVAPAAPAPPAPAVAATSLDQTAIANVVTVAAKNESAQPSLVTPLTLGNARNEALMAAAIRQANDQFAWIRETQLSPLQPLPNDSLQLGSSPAVLKQNPR